MTKTLSDNFKPFRLNVTNIRSSEISMSLRIDNNVSPTSLDTKVEFVIDAQYFMH
jgi:hypothetical protein